MTYFTDRYWLLPFYLLTHTGAVMDGLRTVTSDILRLRYVDFSVYQDGGRRHLGFLKFLIFNYRTRH